jgi:putative ABC transport system permease protein
MWWRVGYLPARLLMYIEIMRRFFDTFGYTLERIWQHRTLVLWALVGLLAAATLALSLVLYVDAVNTDLLEAQLEEPPYAFRFRYLGSWDGNISRDDVTSASAAVQQGFTGTVGLPVQLSVRFVRSQAWTTRLTNEGGAALPLGALDLGTVEGLDGMLQIIAGEWPPRPDDEDEALPVLIAENMLYSMGVQVGDTITATLSGAQPLTLRVAALWRPVNPDDPVWMFPPRFFYEMLLVEPVVFWNALEGIERPVGEAAWQIIFDGGDVRTSDVGPLLSRVANGERDAGLVLPGIRMDLSPVDGLRAFVREVERLTQQLVIVLLPVGGLVLYFVALIAGLLVGRQQSEDLLLRSRGMSRTMLLGVHVLMWLLLAGVALAASALLSPLVVRLIGQTSSFLRFDGVGAPLTPELTPDALLVGGLTTLVAASSGLYLAWRSTRQTITGYRRQSARAARAWWQRMYLDVMLLIPGVYVYYTLTQRGGLVSAADDPFQDPLTFLGPTLFALGLTLLFLRAWPFLLRIGAGVIAYTRSVALLMALRELTRSIGRYRGTLLMMCFTLSLTGLTASMASTIDRSLEDTVNYRIGADAVLITMAEALAEEEISDEGETSFTVTGYTTLPASDLLGIDGVYEATRVGRYPARLVMGNQRIDGTVLGVDRASMAAVTRFRQDFADQSLAELFNMLAGSRTGILLSRKTLVDHNLLIGQEVTLQISALGAFYETTVPVIGLLDYFPTLNPNQGFFAITNLDPIFELVGTELPHDVWLSLEPGAALNAIQQEVRELGFPVLEWRDPQAALQQAQAEPSRRGVLGFLSVGFLASIFLTLVGAIIQNTASFRAQAVQLGSLRAMGLGSGPVAGYLLLLQGIAASSGILGGTSIGVMTTLLFLPLLDFSGGLPPYLVRVAWDEIGLVYMIFAGVLFVVTVLMTLVMSRAQLATVVKLGDA